MFMTYIIEDSYSEMVVQTAQINAKTLPTASASAPKLRTSADRGPFEGWSTVSSPGSPYTLTYDTSKYAVS